MIIIQKGYPSLNTNANTFFVITFFLKPYNRLIVVGQQVIINQLFDNQPLCIIDNYYPIFLNRDTDHLCDPPKKKKNLPDGY